MATVISTNVYELPGTITGLTRYYQLIINITSQDAVANTSTISWQLYANGNYTGWVAEQYMVASLSWDSTGGSDLGTATLYYSATRQERYKGTIATGTLTIPHKVLDGTQTLNAYVGAQVYDYGDGYEHNCKGSTSIVLPTLYQKSEFTAVPDFNDEGNPTVSYRCPLGENADSVAVCISLNGSIDDVRFRDVPKVYNGTYTFQLTEEERNVLRAGTSTADSRIVYFSIETSVNGTAYYDKVPATFSVINAEPTLSPTVEDIDEHALVLTGNKNIILRNLSDVQFNSGAVGKKGATIVSQTITCGAQSITNETGTGSFQDVNSDTFIFTAVDSRGKKVTQTVTKQLISYIDLTCYIFDATAPDGNGNFKFMTRGSYYHGSLGTINNSLKVQYRYMPEGGEYTEWADMTSSVGDGMHTSHVYITGLDYQTRYLFQARAQDEYHKLLGTWVETPETWVQGRPVFDWSKEDFNFNVPVTIQGGSVDTIIEQGLENGWYYRKWASGFAECWYRYVGKIPMQTNYNGVYYSNTISVEYPFPFTTSPVVNVNGGGHATVNWARAFAADEEAAAFIVISNVLQDNAEVTVNIHTVGMWR